MAARGGGFSDRMDQMRGTVEMRSTVERQFANQVARPDAQGLEELNLLLKGSIKQVEHDKDDDWFGEDGFPKDESDPLDYVTIPEEDWPAPEPYQVVYKRVAIRKGPSTEAKVVGTAEQGEILMTYGTDQNKEWRRIHYKLRGGWGSCVVAWVLEEHSKLGRLLKLHEEEQPTPETDEAAAGQQEDPNAAQQGAQPQEQQQQQQQGEAQAQPAQEQPAAPAAKVGPSPITVAELEDCARELEELIEMHNSKAAKKEKKTVSELELLRGAAGAPEDSEEEEEAATEFPTTTPEGYVYATVEELDEGAESMGLQYQVVHKPFVAVRHLAGPKGKVVNSLEYGSYVDTFGWDAKKKWRKIFCRMPNDGRIITAWMMTSHPELGPLVEPAAG